jgi:hypothetical protein
MDVFLGGCRVIGRRGLHVSSAGRVADSARSVILPRVVGRSVARRARTASDRSIQHVGTGRIPAFGRPGTTDAHDGSALRWQHRCVRLNKTARKALAKNGVDDEILAVTQMGISVGLAATAGTGAGMARTVFSLDYATSRGLDLTTPGLRNELADAWVTLTPTRLLFHESNVYAPRQIPRDPITEMDRTGVTLVWFDQPAYGITARILHFTFPDDTQVLAASMYQAKLRRKPVSDELDLFVQAFGDAATRHER